MAKYCILDGALCEGESTTLRLHGSGFAYGYGIFETIRFVEARPCFFAQHFDRLRRAAGGAGLAFNHHEKVLWEAAVGLFEANEVQEGVFKIVIFDDGGLARTALFVRESGPRPAARPARLELSDVVKPSKAFTTRHKTLNYMETVRELAEARDRGIDERVYRNERGFVTECSVSNLFWVKSGKLMTPSLDCGLLDGIARAEVIAAARALGLECEEGCYELESLLEAEEAFLTNSGRGLVSVESFSGGGAGEATYGVGCAERLSAAFLERERASIESGSG